MGPYLVNGYDPSKEEEDNLTDIVVVFKPEKEFPCEMCVKTLSRKKIANAIKNNNNKDNVVFELHF